jgi:predicted TPR repeat methyltransferase
LDFEKAAEKDPQNSPALDRLGLTYESSGEADKAIRAYTQEMALVAVLASQGWRTRIASSDKSGNCRKTWMQWLRTKNHWKASAKTRKTFRTWSGSKSFCWNL